MAILAALLPIVTALASNGLNLLADVALKKGKEFVEEKAGVKLNTDTQGNLPPETLVVLRKYEMDNEVELKKIALEERKIDVEELKQLKDGEGYLEELKTKTIPWVDALHKMGRQIMNYVLVGYALVCVFTGHEITQYELLLIGGPNIAYQLIKGKGMK